MKIHGCSFKSFIKKAFFALVTGIAVSAQAQHSTCPNSDFSLGNFTNWTGYTSVYPYNTPGTNIGTSISPYPSPPYYFTTGIVQGRQTIITTSTPDVFTCGNVMTIPPGEKQSVRLGNGGVGTWGDGARWQRDFLTYQFAITPDNALITYKYAAVLQDAVPLHERSVSPRLIVTLRDLQDKIIDSAYTSSYVYPDTISSKKRCLQKIIEQNGGVFDSEGDVIYTDWTTVAMDLRAYTGRTLILKFETWDCGMGGHFGYAYLTAKCGEMKIKASSCIPGKPLTLTAPEGFTYKWLPSGETTRSITLNNAQLGDSARVELSAPSGYKTFLTTRLFQNYPVAGFSVDSITCAGLPVYFKNKSASVAEYWNWNFGDGSTDSVQNPVHTYLTKGAYRVRLIVRNTDGCADSVEKIIEVCPSAGINNLMQSLTFHAYPNPSTGTFHVEAGQANLGNVKVEIADILGRVIYSEDNVIKNGSLQKELDIKEQPDGIYFVSIKHNEFMKVIKLVKKN